MNAPVTVTTPKCSKLPDGRSRHMFVSVSGQFVCSNCGTLSIPGQRWEKAFA